MACSSCHQVWPWSIALSPTAPGHLRVQTRAAISTISPSAPAIGTKVRCAMGWVATTLRSRKSAPRKASCPSTSAIPPAIWSSCCALAEFAPSSPRDECTHQLHPEKLSAREQHEVGAWLAIMLVSDTLGCPCCDHQRDDDPRPIGL